MKLGQDWVSRATSADAPESPAVIGADPAALVQEASARLEQELARLARVGADKPCQVHKPSNADCAFCRWELLLAVRAAIRAAESTRQRLEDGLRRAVIAWDSDDDMEFLAAISIARCLVGLRLADPEDEEVLRANGYGPELDAALLASSSPAGTKETR